MNNNRILLLTLAALVGAVALYVNSKNETDTTAPIDNTASPATSKQEETMTDSTTSNTISTSSGLQYRILKEGSGIEKPEPNSVVTVHYRGKLTDGFEFDSSYKRNQPATFPVNGVIRGWTEALQLMSVGDKWELTIPPELGYGSQGAGDTIPPDAILIFEVELLEIK